MLVKLNNSRLGAWSIDSTFSELDIKKYSAFKHGRSGIATDYASDIFRRVLIDRLDMKTTYSVLLSPSSYLPTASHAIGISLCQIMQEKGFSTNFVKIQRDCTYSIDYGKLNTKERMDLIKNDKFAVEERFCEEEELLFVDDVSISGSHQYILEEMLRNNNIKNKVTFLYYAILNDQSIGSNIESLMNNSLVKDISDLTQLMSEADFVLNTRVVKLILNSNKLEEKWLEKISLHRLRQIIVGAKGNNYDQMSEYRNNLRILEQELLKREKTLF